MKDLFDFRNEIHEEMLLNSTFYSDITENIDISNESFNDDEDA